MERSNGQYQKPTTIMRCFKDDIPFRGDNQMDSNENQVGENKLTVREYAASVGISVTTVYRYIKLGKLGMEKVDGISYVVVNENQMEPSSNDNETQQLENENQQLRDQITHLIRQLEQSSERHDTILSQMTKQLERKTLQLEDLQNKQPLWPRIKIALNRRYELKQPASFRANFKGD